MHPLDAAILAGYLSATLLIGTYFSHRQRNISDYFVGGRQIPWWAVMGSIVATETSTVTFISVPGFAFGGDLTFLQLAMGYIVGRILITSLLLPGYFRRQLLTVYQVLGDRFGLGVRQLMSAVFLLTRSLADGLRLFATGLVLAALLLEFPDTRDVVAHWVPAVDSTLVVLVMAVLILGVVTIVYTYMGGMAAVIWTDVTQLVVYLVGAAAAALVLLGRVPGGWTEIVEVGAAAGKFRVFDFSWDPTRGYTFWSGLIGGAFLTAGTHGTDQLMVQRYLCSRSPRAAGVALVASGGVVFAQFTLFLLIGVMLYVFYVGQAPAELVSLTSDGRLVTDRVFPHFIVTQLPPGLVGLVVAAVFAAAMSTLSSSLNSSSAASLVDFYRPWVRRRRSHDLELSRRLTAVWGLVQIAVGLAAIGVSRRLVDEVLGIASFTNGIVLGVFLLGTFTRRVRQRAAFAGILIGAAGVLAVAAFTSISWQWYVLIGSVATYLAGTAASYLDRPRERSV